MPETGRPSIPSEPLVLALLGGYLMVVTAVDESGGRRTRLTAESRSRSIPPPPPG